MKKEISGMIRKAERSLNTALRLHKDGDYDFAISRAYYSMFYMAKACLNTKNLSFSKHSGIFPQKYYKIFYFAFDQRNASDYTFIIEFPEELSERIIKDAQDFLNITRIYLEAFINEQDR
jgi:uncharacterized protein (UPF0332 family)